jgi:hypothetical protein
MSAREIAGAAAGVSVAGCSSAGVQPTARVTQHNRALMRIESPLGVKTRREARPLSGTVSPDAVRQGKTQ